MTDPDAAQVPDVSELVRDLGPDAAAAMVAWHEMRTALGAGDAEGAVAPAARAADAALKAVDAGLRDLLGVLLETASVAADHDARSGALPAALQRLSAVRERAHRHGAPLVEAWAGANLAGMHVQAGDFEAALPYALGAARLVGAASEFGVLEYSSERAVSLLTQLAHAFYYERDAYEQVVLAADAALALAPEEPLPLKLKGFALVRLERFEDALGVLSDLQRLEPDDPQHARNRAQLLVALDRDEEAAAALETAVAVGDLDARAAMGFGQAFAGIGAHARALELFTQARDLARAEVAREAAPAAAPRSQAEYMRETPARDLVDMALASMVQAARAAGDPEAALLAARDLLDAEDAPTRALGSRLRAELLAERGRPAEALDAWRRAVAERPDDRGLRIHLADALFAADRVDDALAALTAIVWDAGAGESVTEHAEAVIERAERVLALRPGDAAALRLRGLAHFAAWHPRLALDDLEAAGPAFPEDVTLLATRALARVQVDIRDTEAAWNEALDARRIIGAAVDLATATRLAPHDAEVRRQFLWIVDRATGHPSLMFQLAAEPAVAEALPDLHDIMTTLGTAERDSGRQDWAQATRLHQDAQARLAALGLSLWAARQDVLIADNLLRLYDLQPALEHIRRVRTIPMLAARPLTKSLEPQADHLEARSRTVGGKDALAIELDYAPLVTLGFYGVLEQLPLLEATAYVRLGDHARARAALGDPDEFLDGIREDLPVSRFRVANAVVVILRDCGDLAAAAALLPRLEALATNEYEHMTRCVTAATIALSADLPEEALEQLQEARAFAATPEESVHVELNVAGIALNQGRLADALAILDAPRGEDVTLSERGAFKRHTMRSHVMHGLGRFEEAETEALAALAISDRTRTALLSVDSRIGWQAEEEQLFALATWSALDRGLAGRALEYAERARSRAFAEQLAAGHLPLPEAARADAELEERIERRVRLLQQLGGSAPGFVDHEVVAQVRALVPDLELLDADGALSAEQLESALTDAREALDRVRERVDEVRAEYSPETIAPVLTTAELRAVLAA